jgi:hypothetical protein
LNGSLINGQGDNTQAMLGVPPVMREPERCDRSGRVGRDGVSLREVVVPWA